jgi:hypothetical protein
MIKPIKNNSTYEKSLERAYELMQKKLKTGSSESDELENYLFLLKNTKTNIIKCQNPIL